ncbi:uncharacterized protein HGUI_00913 [Hanseniaspora guilliermondii]|uniref:HSF-type DNA-binding domain-containing protein n=1 Tax=Hanseniaspora guilliermondii TaxID=56406 RepID=A0A1L0CK22_9ASCO|nr:uncharacterized protein HGUI_00913 [Hanseniaspora guilliermondii]
MPNQQMDANNHLENLDENGNEKFTPPIKLNDISKSVTAYSLNPSTFTQKLYVMLKDENLKDVIYWNENTKDSFFIIPNEKFIQVLSIFFKHCNTSSFVRQLNMYSFHKISGDTNNIWEFKHAESLFQKDNIESLYKVKRRSTITKPSNNPKKSSLKKVTSYDSIPLKRKSLDNMRDMEPKQKHRVSSLPNVYLQNNLDKDQRRKDSNQINQNQKSYDLHQLMLDELNAMNSSLQSICDLVEYSHDQIKVKMEGLSQNENAMYRQVFGKLFQDLNKQQAKLKQHFDAQFGSTGFNPSLHFSPITPFGSFSNKPPALKRNTNLPEQLPIMSYQQVMNVPMPLKTPVSSSQSMYPIPMENQMIPQMYPSNIPMVYPDKMFAAQPQFRDVKYGMNTNSYMQKNSFVPPMDPNTKPMMMDNKNNSLPNLKNVISLNNTDQDNSALYGKGVKMNKTISGGSPKSS